MTSSPAVLQELSLFDGPAITVADDGALSKQLETIRRFMLDGQFRTLAEIAYWTGFKEQSVSARLRDLRKAKWGRYTVERVRVAPRTFSYRVCTP